MKKDRNHGKSPAILSLESFASWALTILSVYVVFRFSVVERCHPKKRRCVVHQVGERITCFATDERRKHPHIVRPRIVCLGSSGFGRWFGEARKKGKKEVLTHV